MVIHVLPVGVRGIVVAGLLAALMSSLAGVFNASSTLFTMDIYQKYRPNASQHQLVWMGRMATFVCVLIGIAWIPVIKNSRGLYDYLQGVQGYLAPPIFVVFFLGVFWKRLNAAGCLAGLLTGFLLGLFRLALDTSLTFQWVEPFAEGSFLWIVSNIYFQYFSILITLVSMIAMVTVSYMTAEPSAAQISGLTFATTTDAQKQESRDSWSTLGRGGDRGAAWRRLSRPTATSAVNQNWQEILSRRNPLWISPALFSFSAPLATLPAHRLTFFWEMRKMVVILL